MNKKVSIIVPLYKSEIFMFKLLDSIINQTYYNLEIILVDDGSPDKSGEIADMYALKDNRIKVVHQKNSGTCAARNKGVEIASGDYLMFVDGDDWLETDCVEYLVDLLEKNNATMAMTDSIFTTRDRVQNDCDNIRIWDSAEAVAGIINTFIIPVGPWNKLYSMDIIKKNKICFSVPWFGEGLYFSTMVAQYSNRIVVGHKKIYNYRLNNSNSGCTKREIRNGVNSLNNIIHIKQVLEIDSEEIQNALNWHIWFNNYNLITYIIGAEQIEDYKEELKNARKALYKYLPLVLKHDKLGGIEKLKIIIKTINPIFFAKKSLNRMDKAFKEDAMREV